MRKNERMGIRYCSGSLSETTKDEGMPIVGLLKIDISITLLSSLVNSLFGPVRIAPPFRTKSTDPLIERGTETNLGLIIPACFSPSFVVDSIDSLS